jgi:outer membrane receptor protein involved in Fe transport
VVGNRLVPLVVAAWFGVLLLPVTASAQSSIAGVVKDTSGAVLPGVQVEVSSPVLIEQSRTAITDSQGVYRVVDLRPGTYKVTFTLQGFSDLRARGHRAADGIYGDRERGYETWLDRGDDHGFGRNQIDFRVSRRFAFGGTRVEPQFNIYNLTNSDDVVSETTRYGPAWQNVTGVLPPRMVKLGVQIDF